MKDNFSERLLYVMKLKNIQQRDIVNVANVSPMWLAGYDVPMPEEKEE